MERLVFKVKIPAKIMLTGEYVALSGFKVLSSSINRYFCFNLIKIDSRYLEIKTSYYKKALIVRDRKDIKAIGSDPLRESLLFCMDQGIDIFGYRIEEESLIGQGGFGSSSSLILAILTMFGSKQWDERKICFNSYMIQKGYQGQASGYDVITQYHGGILEYQLIGLKDGDLKDQANFYRIEEIQDRVGINNFIHIFSSDASDSTKSTLNYTLNYLKKEKKIFDNLVQKSLALHEELKVFIQTACKDSGLIDQRLKKIFYLVDKQQSFFSDLKLYPDIIRRIKKLDGYLDKFCIKTSGAGGKDAFVVFGKIQDIDYLESFMKQEGWTRISEGFIKQGIDYEYMG